MAAPAVATAAKKPALVLLELDYTDGGSSPWFNSKGRSFVASLTTGPVTADLFRALAEDGSMSALASYIESESPSVSNVTTICYVLIGLVLLGLFLLLPLALFGLRRFAAAVGFVPWLLCELLLLTFAGIQLICLLAMLTTWHGMKDGLAENIPTAYEWTFEMLRNYTTRTVQMLKEAKDANTELDNNLATTTAGIKWLRGNISRWEDKFSGYTGLTSLLTGVASMVHMGILGFALAVAITSALIACGAWRRRAAHLAKGRKSPVFVALAAVAATVLLCAHLVVALPTIARWLPVCVLADTYLCAPYRDGSYSILDNSVRMVWPPSSRPDPFCRLIPSTLLKKCAVKGKTPIKYLEECPKKKDSGKLMIVRPDDAVIEFQAQKPPQKQPAGVPAAGSAGKNVIGDCFYPYKVISTDMTSVCPLLTDDLLAHWMAMVISVLVGFATTLAAAAVAVIFMAVGEPMKKSVRKPPPRKRFRSTKKRKYKRRKKRATPPSQVPSRSHTSVQTEGTPPGPAQLNIVLEEPCPVPMKRRRRSQPFMLMRAPPPPLPIPVPVPVPIPVMPRLSPHTRADSQDAQISASAPTIIPTSRSDVSPLSAVDYGSARGHHHCACDMRNGACHGRAHGPIHPGCSPSALPQPGYSCMTAPNCKHSAPAYMACYTPMCNRMRGVSPTAVEVMPARPLIGGGTVQRPCRPPCGSSAHEKPQQL